MTAPEAPDVPASPTAAYLLERAAQLPREVLCKLAHALGWPHPQAFHHQRPGRVKWANPYRNYYAGNADDPDWRWAESEGLARKAGDPQPGYPYTTWTVTELGRRVVRLRLEATRYAPQVTP